jgi:flagellar biosynthetic protein FliR
MSAPELAPLDLFSPGTASVLVLFACRVSGVVLVAPVFSARTIPMQVRTALVIALTILLGPIAASAHTAQPVLTPGTFLSETLIGFVIGMGAAIWVGAAETAGEMLAIQIGLSGAAIVDPTTSAQGPALGQFLNLFAIALLLSLNGHVLMLDALAASMARLPVGGTVNIEGGLGSLAALGTTLFSLGLRFAAPVVAVVLIANVALAVLSRAAPQLNILTIAFPIQIGVGLFALTASLPFLALWFSGWNVTYDGVLTRLFGALSPLGAR